MARVTLWSVCRLRKEPVSIKAAELEGVLLLGPERGWCCLLQSKAALSLGALTAIPGTQQLESRPS